MQQLIRTIKNPLRLFVTQLQTNLIHTLEKKNNQQNISYESKSKKGNK